LFLVHDFSLNVTDHQTLNTRNITTDATSEVGSADPSEALDLSLILEGGFV
jgi:hypothetical protein